AVGAILHRFTNGVPSNSFIVSRNGLLKSSRKLLSSASSVSSSTPLYQASINSHEHQLRSISTFPPLCMGRRSSKIAGRKGAQDAKKAKLYSRIGKEVVSAVKKGGPNPVSNMVLAAVLEKARELDVPKEILERNIKRASEKGQEAYIEKVYEVSYYKIVSSAENYATILSKLRDEGINFETDNGSELLPITTIEVDDEAMDLNKELLSKLLELDDVDAVYTDQK
ncbi:UPF0082 protein isoform 2, partial [Theobroma cacao]